MMTDKQMIIDGKECRYWFRLNPDDYRKCSLRGKNDNCDEIKDCFVKELLGKLALKEQECEELKIYIKSNEQQVKEAETLVMDNDRLINELDQLKQTLAEIKEIAEEKSNVNDWLALEILQKISECEVENE